MTLYCSRKGKNTSNSSIEDQCQHWSDKIPLLFILVSSFQFSRLTNFIVTLVILSWDCFWPEMLALDFMPSGDQQKPSFVRFNYFQWSKKCCSHWGPFLLKISNIMPGIHMKLTREHREVGTGMENVNEPEMVNNEFNFFMYLLKLARGGENQRIVLEKKTHQNWHFYFRC